MKYETRFMFFIPKSMFLQLCSACRQHGAHVDTANDTRHAAHHGKNMTSFTKPEVYNVLHVVEEDRAMAPYNKYRKFREV